METEAETPVTNSEYQLTTIALLYVTKTGCQGNSQDWLRLSNELQTESKNSDSLEFYGS